MPSPISPTLFDRQSLSAKKQQRRVLASAAANTLNEPTEPLLVNSWYQYPEVALQPEVIERAPHHARAMGGRRDRLEREGQEDDLVAASGDSQRIRLARIVTQGRHCRGDRRDLVAVVDAEDR